MVIFKSYVKMIRGCIFPFKKVKYSYLLYHYYRYTLLQERKNHLGVQYYKTTVNLKVAGCCDMAMATQNVA